jgi:hypothetical protein
VKFYTRNSLIVATAYKRRCPRLAGMMRIGRGFICLRPEVPGETMPHDGDRQCHRPHAGGALQDPIQGWQSKLCRDPQGHEGAWAEIEAGGCVMRKLMFAPSPLAGEGGVKRRMRGCWQLDSLPPTPHPSCAFGAIHLLPQGEKAELRKARHHNRGPYYFPSP